MNKRNMANKEVYRTIGKLWLLKYCIVIVIITLQLSSALCTETEEVITPQNSTSIASNTTSQEPVAEPLVRYRRQPPRTIVKHIVRPKRYKIKRIKRPKIKYSFAEPPPTYYIRKPTITKTPTFDSSLFEDLSHKNVESAEFDLPLSSYESQSMELDFYKHYEPSIQADSYKEIHKPSLYTYTDPDVGYKESSYTEVTKKPPSYKYSAPEISNQRSVTYSSNAARPRAPHAHYGVPTEFVYNTGYDKPSNYKYTFEVQTNRPVYTEVEKPYYKEQANNKYPYNSMPSKNVPRIPATTYGVPDIHIPAAGSNDYNKYSVVVRKPSYASHKPTKVNTYHFAEPPEPEPAVEITYSPSYEINIPSSHENSYLNDGNDALPQHPLPEQHPPPQKHPLPKQHPPPQQQPAPQQHPSIIYDEPNYHEQPKYDESTEQYDPPEDTYARPPQDSYEDNTPGHQEVSGTNQPANYQPAPPTYQNINEYLPPSEELPININHKHPPYDYPKSSYEVPIYDPIPFDSSNQQEREIYPPQTFLPANGQRPPAANDSAVKAPIPSNTLVHSSDITKRPQSPINHSRRTHKWKHPKGSLTTASNTKHILDVPELQEAFEKENRNKLSSSHDPDAHESQRLENVNSHNDIKENYSNGPWNPLKIRTPSVVQITSSTIIPPTISKNKRPLYKLQRKNTTTSTTTTQAPSNVKIISIEKSRSKTYYDGPASAPKTYNTIRHPFRKENANTSTTPRLHIESTNERQFSDRTTKNVFDTTVFRSPINDRGLYRNLPKNHKLN